MPPRGTITFHRPKIWCETSAHTQSNDSVLATAHWRACMSEIIPDRLDPRFLEQPLSVSAQLKAWRFMISYGIGEEQHILIRMAQHGAGTDAASGPKIGAFLKPGFAPQISRSIGAAQLTRNPFGGTASPGLTCEC